MTITGELLEELALLTHKGRMRRMVEFGRLARHDQGVREAIGELLLGSIYERLLGLQTCFGSGDAEPALQALNDPSRSVRSLAGFLLVRLGSDVQVLAGLEKMALKAKAALLYSLDRRHRQTAIDAYIETLIAPQDRQLKRLLPLASQDLVRRALPPLIDTFDVIDWQRLARMHPEVAHAQIRSWIQTTSRTPQDRRLLQVVNVVIPGLSDVAPDLALDLIQAMHTLVSLARLPLNALITRRPREVADLVLASNEASSISFLRIVRHLSTEQLLALFEHYPNAIHQNSLGKLKPEQRVAIYQLYGAGWRNSEGIIALRIVATLPTEQRVAEARRHLELPALQTRPAERIPYAAFLPWDEAVALLDRSLRSPDAETRALTLRTLIAATRYQSNHLKQALQLVLQRRFEQDPVRLAMLTALAELPAGRWQEDDLSDLTRIVRDALDASDLSPASVHALLSLVAKLLPFYSAWSSTQLALIYREREYVRLPQLTRKLTQAETRHLADALLPLLPIWRQRENEGILLTLASLFKRRLPDFPELLAILETLLHDTRHSATVQNILRLFKLYLPERLDVLVPRLLEQDKSVITIQAVSAYLHRYRQDLLTPFLGQHAYEGRFSTGKTRMVLGIDSGFQRWTPQQQQLFAQTLLELAHQEDRPVHELLHTLHQLEAMAFIDAADIIAFANDQRLPVRDEALRVLSRLDAGQGIPTLFAALDDNRARIAIYALRSILLKMPEAEALKLLQDAPLNKITVAKEVVRLIGELGTEAAYQQLQAMQQQELHRDVRIALLRALWSYLERPETWESFRQAAQDPDLSIAQSLGRLPADGLSSWARVQLLNLLALLLNHPEPEVRLSTLRRFSYLPITDLEQLLAPRLIQLMQSPLPDESTSASQAVFTIYAEQQTTLIGEAIRELRGKRRELSSAINVFLQNAQWDRQRRLPTTHILLQVLAEDPLTVTLRLKLILNGLPWDELTPALLALAPELHADALVSAEREIEQLTMRPDIHITELEQSLASSPDPHLRRLALSALVAQTRRGKGWDDQLRGRLHTYQQDPAPLVAETAQYIFPV